MVASDGAADDLFDRSVSLSGACVIVGAYGDDNKERDSGSAYVFGKILCPGEDLTGDSFVNLKDLAKLAGKWLQGVE